VKVYTQPDDFKAIRPVVTIGTFDGVHLGHRKIISRLKEIAAEAGGETVIFTFHPHPRQILTPEEHNLRLINTLDEKIKLLSDSGIDHLIVYPFTLEFAAMPYTDFVGEILVKQIGTYCLVVGHDHKFGKNRQGNFDYLHECAAKFNFRIDKLDALLVDEVNVSSTRIRYALEQGDISLANKYLGYPYELHGKVVEGKQMGRIIGFPTANIESSDVNKLIPGYGVYAVKVRLNGSIFNGMLNIGTRPTFNLNADLRSIEVNIFDFDEDIYNRNISILFIEKIRNEQKFPGKEALIEQLYRDRESALKSLNESRFPTVL
jgi:riboflavin kinase/FMN adenylyltransferase